MERAVQQSRRRRQLARSESAVKEVGLAQEWLLRSGPSQEGLGTSVCFYPKHEAGGDFFGHFRPEPGRQLCLLTDVSGHDVQAAYISAYFQGLVRGMLERTATLREIFSAFNRHLVEDWNSAPDREGRGAGVKVSVAACGILIDTNALTATVIVQGTPAPVYWTTDGRAMLLGQTGGFPLGWFPEEAPPSIVQTINKGGCLCLWTDGLEDAAEKLGVSELSLALALQRAKDRGGKPADLSAAADDVLVADIQLPGGAEDGNSFRPVLLEAYAGNRTGEIDAFQAQWNRSLKLAVPGIRADKLHDILLSSREGVLNALQHGCGGCASQWARFEVAYSEGLQTVRIHISDPGPGHTFDSKQHDEAAGGLAEAHRGLMLLGHFATQLIIERNGASVSMDFSCQ